MELASIAVMVCDNDFKAVLKVSIVPNRCYRSHWRDN